MGFKFNLVLADSLSGERGTNFISVLDELDLNWWRYAQTILLSYYQDNIQYLKWHRFKRVFSYGENRFIREIIHGQRREHRWQTNYRP